MRVLKYLGILLFIGVGYSFIQFEQQEQQKEQVRKEEIEQYEKQEVVDPSILGMITLVKTGKKSLIKQGEIEEILAQNQVVSLTQTLDTKEDLYLAGHSIPQVFGDLHDYQIGDRLLLSFQNQQQEYEIYQTKKVSISDFQVFQSEEDFPRLVLITCTNHQQIRYVVFAKSVHS